MLSHGGVLHAFVGTMKGGHDLIKSCAVYVLDEPANRWQPRGEIADLFLPNCRPVEMADGKWIMAGRAASRFGVKPFIPAVAISPGDDLTGRWNVVPLQAEFTPAHCPETTVWVEGSKLFAGLGSCTSSQLDAPCDFRGTVWSMEAGRSVSYDRDLGPGWKHLTAIRRSDRLELHVNGQLVATSAPFAPADYDLTVDCPLRIGFGEVDYFSGKIREVRLYRRALTAGELQRLAADAP